ncbi:carbon-nitrogen hydrolase family protein [Marinobacterium lutimaris]|uniref:Predicted amidohydrolase n=1 Tax=Marinobacterium lutimaris TaxID=568106 RepID=A0A1H6DEZ7_9GAMM|nr:carbon-nitrogen hydrolase family protein [Marinobacterium lutimaris]SEG83958.1 Predicted amidohydrolase [Marinobacterium lutimaris]
MQNKVVASAVQHQPVELGSMDDNLAFILDRLKVEASHGSELIVFPEAGLTSFFKHEEGGLKRLWEEGSIDLDGPELTAIVEAAKELGVHTVVGFNERSKTIGTIYNSAALIGPEGIVGVQRKRYLPGIEKLYYTPGTERVTFECSLGRIGIIICYEALFPEVALEHFMQGADILVVTSSFWSGGAKGGAGDPVTKKRFWENVSTITAIQNQAFVVSCNACGFLDLGKKVGTWERLGLSQIVSPTQGVLAQAGQFAAETIRAELNLDDLSDSRSNYPLMLDRVRGRELA